MTSVSWAGRLIPRPVHHRPDRTQPAGAEHLPYRVGIGQVDPLVAQPVVAEDRA